MHVVPMPMPIGVIDFRPFCYFLLVLLLFLWNVHVFVAGIVSFFFFFFLLSKFTRQTHYEYNFHLKFQICGQRHALFVDMILTQPNERPKTNHTFVHTRTHICAYINGQNNQKRARKKPIRYIKYAPCMCKT